MSLFMMTTEVNNGERNQQTRNSRRRPSSFDLKSHRIVETNSTIHYPTHFGNPNFRNDDNSINNLTILKSDGLVPSNPMIENTHANAKLSLSKGNKAFFINHHQDEGYGTDNKSNTSPSTTSPLSSSFSSMSTFDGSFTSPTSPSGGIISPNSYNPHYSHLAMHGNNTQQRCPTAPQNKPSLIQGNGKIHVNRHALVMAKKKDCPQETQDNSCVNLEDRLRALTTIEEEEPGLTNATYKKEVYSTREDCGSRFSQPIASERRGNEGDQTSGFFRAVPVEIATRQHPHDQRDCLLGNQNDNPSTREHPNGDNPNQVRSTYGQNTNDKNWYDYRRYFEKDCEIPLHNIDALNHGKFISAGSDSICDKDINRSLERNTPEIREEAVNTNALPTSRQSGNGRNAHREPTHESVDTGGFHGHHNQSGETLSVGQFHGFPQNGQRFEDHGSHQISPSSFPQPGFPYKSQLNPLRRNDDSYRPDDRRVLQSEKSLSLSQSLQQFDNQQPHHQNQLIHQQHPFYTENSQQYLDSQPGNTHNRPSGSYNSLPRHYEDQRQNFPSFYSENQRDSLNQFSENDVVLRRSWASSSTRALSDQVDRYSWQLDSRSKQPNSMGSERYSLDLGNIPQLKKQIRATSEMCLQASKRHVFASSADIYKLFQGQKKPLAPPTASSSNLKDFTRGVNQQHRHSFHSMSDGSWAAGLQHNLPSRDSVGTATTPYTSKQLGFFSNHSCQPSPSPGPIRGDHTIHLPQTSWAGSSFILPDNSLSSSSTFPLTLSDLPHIQRQSSGYSSENELQQIEQNAKAAKKTKNRDDGNYSLQAGNSDQEFVPVDPIQDHDSSSSFIDNEPVYVNQPMLANARARASQSLTQSSPMQQSQSSSSSPPPPPLPARPRHLQMTQATINSSSNGGGDLQLHQPRINGPSSGHDPLASAAHTVISQLDRNPNPSPNPAAVFTQKQKINLNQKQVTINSFVPSHPYSVNSNDTNNPMVNDTDRRSPRGLFPSPLQQQHDFQSNYGIFPTEHQTKMTSSLDNYLSPLQRSNSSRSNRTNSSPCTPLSPLEIAQVLDTPFATNVISDECGDRLSTLV